MKTAYSWILGASVLLFAGGMGSSPLSADESKTKPTRVNPALSLVSITGETISPFHCDAASQKAAVVIFITVDCPIANKFSPEIERIRSSYAGKGVRFTLIHVDPDVTDKDAASHAAEYGHKSEVAIDRQHRIVKAAGATVTPEAVVIDSDGLIRYRGRINDQFAGYGDRRREAKSHDLRNALDSLLAGKKIAVPETRALGCFIPEL